MSSPKTLNILVRNEDLPKVENVALRYDIPIIYSSGDKHEGYTQIVLRTIKSINAFRLGQELWDIDIIERREAKKIFGKNDDEV